MKTTGCTGYEGSYILLGTILLQRESVAIVIQGLAPDTKFCNTIETIRPNYQRRAIPSIFRSRREAFK